ncbi:MAG: hypothetical protein WBX01_09140 [Nitrososphaeraceae archaeon]
MDDTTIIIKKETRNALKGLGLKGETYDQIISKLIRLKTTGPEYRRSQLLEKGNV